jgi:hypothetical protein
MSDRGPNQDKPPLAGRAEDKDATYRDAGYLGTSENDDEEVRDLGFIVDDHDDRRITLTGDWQRLDDLDTDEPLETNRSGPIPHETALRERGAPGDWFATDYHVENADAEEQEEDFAETSMLETDPDMNDGAGDFTSETLHETDGDPIATDLAGHVAGVARGFGTTLPQDMGAGGFQIRDNPLMQPEGAPISGENLSDEALGLRDVDEMGDEDALEATADQVARREGRRRGSGE